MGAYLHVVLPVELHVSKSITQNNGLTDQEILLPPEYKGYFELISSEKKEEKIEIGDFKTTRHTQEVGFQLKDELYKDIKLFFIEFWKTYSDIEKEKQNPLVNIDLLNIFLEKDYPDLDFSREKLDNIDNVLACIYGNYFIRFDGLGAKYVYCGWPFKKKENISESLFCFNILNFWEKLGIERDSEREFENNVQKVKQILGSKYKLCDFLYIIGY